MSEEAVGVSSRRHEELRARYRVERDKRLRPDGNGQYVRMEGEYARLQRDPFKPVQPRAPLFDHVEALIVGGGFAGLLAAARLREKGLARIRIVDCAGDFGGTWYWNRYPGAQCDVESYIYLPLLAETGRMPQTRYSDAAEIFAHAQAIGAHYRLYDEACFQTRVTNMRWREATSFWEVSTDRGDCITAQFIFLADGPLNQPKLPGIPGIEKFRGKLFHASRWDYDYTGGAAGGRLAGLADKRVGLVGTGATAIQCAPHLAASAKHLFVFQRTPSSVLPRNNRATDPVWAATLPPGWQTARMANFNKVTSGLSVEDEINDGLSAIMRRLGNLPRRQDDRPLSRDELERRAELQDFAVMEEVRARVDAIVRDPAAAEALKPWYRLFCKRPCFNDDYLDIFNRPGVTLVDTNGRGVARLTETAVVVGETAYEVDCLILGTGFEVGTDYPRRSGFELHGREGQTLTQKWRDGARTLHGLQTQGFPNCFFLGMTQGGYTANYTHMLYEQSAHIAHLIDEARRRGVRAIEASAAAEDDWVETIQSFGVGNMKFYEECTPGYYNNEGQPGIGRTAKIANFYGGGSEAFFALLRDWREAGDFAGVNFID